ncbi:MAG: hypothetical protein ACJKSS_00965 [Patescibacteria group bacterium UBA2103]
MKELTLGVLLLILVGFGSFLYQNAKNNKPIDKGPVACTLEAKMCPDGSYVGRKGPSCEFEACPTEKVLFDAPEGYTDTLPLLSSIVEGRIGFFNKEPNVISNNIAVYAYSKNNTTLEEVLTQKIKLSPSDLTPDLEDYEIVEIDGQDVYQIVNERFEATVEINHVLDLEDFVVVISHRDISVEKWMQDFTLEELEDLSIVEEVVKSIRVATETE